MKKLGLVFIATLLLANTSFATAEDAVWIDVRSLGEFQSDHIEGALHLPHSSIEKSIAQAVGDKNQRILLYCHSGGRADVALRKLEAMGYKNVSNIGGLVDAKAYLADQSTRE